MQSNYKRLGDYIQKVDNRNRDSKVEVLLGISMTKEFRVSTSNINGTDMSVYKVVNKDQFSCDFMSVIRVHKFPVVLKKDEKPILVSPAYTVFEVKDKEVLNPEYLMMWFRRSEFDRYADFKCDSAIRGGFDWDALCDCLLPIPSLVKQLEIVKEYNVVQNRIKLNNQFIARLEETAQTIYKHWFVDFEFPDEKGLAYKSNGGEMEWCEELGINIPKYFVAKSISQLCNISSSRRIFENEYTSDGVPFYRGKEITLKKNGNSIAEPIFISEKRYNELIKLSGKPVKGDILMTAVGTIGSTYLVQDEKFYFKDGNVIWFRKFESEWVNMYLYDFMQSKSFKDLINEITIGSTQSAITITTFGEQLIVIPHKDLLIRYHTISTSMNNSLQASKSANEGLKMLRKLLLSKMTKVEELA